jgi:predicted acetyltransferase
LGEFTTSLEAIQYASRIRKARERGLSGVSLTCGETNTGSRTIIEINGGHFEDAVVVAGQPDKKLRYWISLDDSSAR